MDIKAIQASYARWAPVYDKTFGAVTNAGRMRTTRFVNRHAREVLEVGVGTGLALPHYAPEVNVTAIDYSEDMLRKARKRVAEMNLRNVRELRQMDARSLDFPDNRRDEIIAYVRQKYGEDHVAQIVTFGTLQARAAVRDTLLALPRHVRV